LASQEFESPYADFSSRLRQIPSSLFNTTRIAILLEIYCAGAVDFVQLKIDQNLTDGSIAAHVKFLEHEGLITVVKKKTEGSRQRTGYLITPKGIEEMEKLLADFAQAAKAIPNE